MFDSRVSVDHRGVHPVLRRGGEVVGVDRGGWGVDSHAGGRFAGGQGDQVAIGVQGVVEVGGGVAVGASPVVFEVGDIAAGLVDEAAETILRKATGRT